jgi:hypothetical protein
MLAPLVVVGRLQMLPKGNVPRYAMMPKKGIRKEGDGSPDVCARCGSDMGRYIGSMAQKTDLLLNHGVTTIAVS